MKQMDVFKKIGGILKELNDQYDYLQADSSDLNELELELFVANAHFLKDHAEILRRLHERNATPAQTQAQKPEPAAEISQPELTFEKKQDHVHEQHYFEPVVQQKHHTEDKPEPGLESEPAVQQQYDQVETEPVASLSEDQQPVPQIDLETESTGDSFSFERREPEPVKEELEIDEAPESDWEDEEDHFEQEELTEQLPPVTPEIQAVPEPPFTLVTAEHASNEVNDHEDKVLTINQKISALKAEKEKGTVPPSNVLPVTDLKSAINLNDKLLYIKDLFNGYSLAYSEAVEIVNRFNSFEEAERFLKTNYVVKNNWEGKPATVEKFFALLKRRYPVSDKG